MNLLEEKGISNEFVDKISEFSTTYEHNLYVSLLEKMQKFTSGK
jgi:complement component 1 Q subcomponent-binding protein